MAVYYRLQRTTGHFINSNDKYKVKFGYLIYMYIKLF